MSNDLIPYRPQNLQRRRPQPQEEPQPQVTYRFEVHHYDEVPWPDAWFLKVLAITFLIVIVGAAIVVGIELAMLAELAAQAG